MIYLDNAATTFPKPATVNDAVLDCMSNWCANPGRAGHKNAMLSGDCVFSTRKTISRLIGAKPIEIVFTCNCTAALNMGIKGLLKPGDHVVTDMMEHNSVLRPLYSLRSSGVEISVVGCDSEGNPIPGAFERAIKKNTKLIICTLASNVTGTIMPIHEIGYIAKKHGIIFMVDAAQGLGAVSVNVDDMNIDMLASSGHKSLLGPQGTGFLYVKQNVPVEPYIQGGTGTDSRNVKQPELTPEGFESGTLNVPGIAGLNAGIEHIAEIGIENIKSSETGLIEFLQDELSRIDGIKMYGPSSAQERAGVLAFNIEGMDCEAAAERLDREYGIAVRAGFHCAPLAHKAIGTEKSGCIRISVGPFNTYDDMAAVVRAVKNMV
ncbi:MAG: aminotransferase class V-fold PLP-dependent enzyme [Firmicutes bacterium]|nr:aminotransferase class V-fold PLP-dependent enzyme [Bacillota bacterium]